MTFATDLAAMQATVYDRYGSDASWPGVVGVVKVIREAPDKVEEFGRGGRYVAASVILKVRRSEVSAPTMGDQPTVDGVVYRVIADPTLQDDRRTEWTCEAAEVAP